MPIVAGLFWTSASARGQQPTVETPQIQGATANPGSSQSRLGPAPGGGDMILGSQPGRDDLLLGRAGPASPRVPTSIATPGQGDQVRRPPPISVPEPLPVPRAPLYGTLALPSGEESEGPANGLTLDQAIDLLVRRNYDLRSKAMEIPQARADVLTASLRANPIFYADSQLIPYGSYSERRPGGPTQYDVNISHPIDFSRKRRARVDYATRAMRVTEAQYQDAVRIEINNLYTAFLDVLAARQTLRFARASEAGSRVLAEKTQLLYERDIASRADVGEVRSQGQVAQVGVLDSEENLRKANRVLGMMLGMEAEEAEALEVRGSIEDRGPPPPPVDELIRAAVQCRPDVVSYRLGVLTAESGVRLSMANRYQDAYLLYQPYTYQNNAPLGGKSATSWAIGLTVPLPVYNRNQGNIERARQNVTQSRIELEGIEKRVVAEVKQAAREYEVSGQIVDRIRAQVLPTSQASLNDRLRLFQGGEANAVSYLQAQRTYNDTVKAYLDTVVRHRRSMLGLNTAVGQRILP
ncbi:Cobalt-zinc-cadmium resistance protein CzcC precursor [Aquisphaera giovannonii]|uniref:Cobalt-zinc-cadmium resistance protein CzcC n=2 Tax=Aquisphaera giovannonii TaxID=406548 RepID=A0A5B9WAR4_9BACT|nr:Cobalt-zinc-cadmium resistance protein CzcC precursor [Aquisphaera giovannonii]